jgi:hypothetical protein
LVDTGFGVFVTVCVADSDDDDDGDGSLVAIAPDEPQADKMIETMNSRERIFFIIDSTLSLRAAALWQRSNLLQREIASGKEQERPRNDM